MPTSCSAPNCTQRFAKGSGIRFYRFPKENDRKIRWQIALRRRSLHDSSQLWEPADHDRICSRHFVTGMPSKDPEHQDYSPSIIDFTPLSKQTPSQVARFERTWKRRKLAFYTPKHSDKNLMPIADALLSLGLDKQISCDKGTDPEPDPLQAQFEQLSAEHIALQQDYQRVLSENRDLKVRLDQGLPKPANWQQKFEIGDRNFIHISSNFTHLS